MALQEPKLQERRAEARVDYQVKLLFAVYDGDSVPPLDTFHCAETRNLSPLGVSFFCESPVAPQQKIAMRLGSDQQPIFLAGTVIHSQLDRWGDIDQYFVGVRFIDRLVGPETSQPYETA